MTYKDIGGLTKDEVNDLFEKDELVEIYGRMLGFDMDIKQELAICRYSKKETCKLYI